MEDEKSLGNWFCVDEHKNTLRAPSISITRFVQGMYLGFVDMLKVKAQKTLKNY